MEINITTKSGTSIIVSQNGRRLKVTVPGKKIENLPVRKVSAGLLAIISVSGYGVITFALDGDNLVKAHALADAADAVFQQLIADEKAYQDGYDRVINANYGSK